LLVAIAGGGALGALMRYGLTKWMVLLFGKGFPYGTLAANISGSFLMGLMYVFFVDRLDIAEEWRFAILTGLLGAFTTFSTFSVETINLLQEGTYMKAGLNVILSVILCLFAAWFGMMMGRQI